MFKLLGLVHKAASMAVIGGVAWLGWQHLGPETPNVDSELADAGKTVIAQVVTDLRKNREDVRHVALLRFEGDGSGAVTEALRERIEFSGALDLEPKGLITKARKHLNLREPDYGEASEALAEGKSLGVEGVIFGKVRRFETVAGGVAWDIDVGFGEVGSSKTLMQKTYSHDDSTDAKATTADAGAADSASGYSWFTRSLAWLLIVLLLPVITISFIRAAARKNSNGANAFVLGVYTLSDAALACLLVGAALTSWPGIIMLVIATGLALAYNIRMMSYGLHLEKT